MSYPQYTAWHHASQRPDEGGGESEGAGEGGESEGGGGGINEEGGGELKLQREVTPQSEQSVQGEQAAYSAPWPPSSQSPSEAWMHASVQGRVGGGGLATGGGDGGDGGGGGGRGLVPHGVPKASPQTQTPCAQSGVPSQGKPGQVDGAHSTDGSMVGQVTLPEMPKLDGGVTDAPAEGHVSHMRLPPWRWICTCSWPALLQRVG